MKSIVRNVVVATALVIPAVSFAHGSQITRAQVRAELEALESVGYHPGAGDDPHYPESIQAAEAKLAAQRGEAAYGGLGESTTQSSRGVSKANWNSMYSRP